MIDPGASEGKSQSRRHFLNRIFVLTILASFVSSSILTHAFVLLISSGVEFGENMRFRFPVDGLFVLLVAVNVLLLRRQRRPDNEPRQGRHQGPDNVLRLRRQHM